MKVLTWNVNGLATTLQYYPWSETKSYKDLLDTLDCDILCFQEVKCQRSKLTREMALVQGYSAYFSFSKVKLGYSGVAVYIKNNSKAPLPLRTYEGVTGVLDSQNDFLYDLSTPAQELDAEGRCIILDFGLFVLFNVYFPNDSNETRIEFKMDYHHCVQKRIEAFLAQGKQVLLVGDINAVHEEIDHCDAKQSIKDHNLSDFKDLPQRRWLDNLIDPKGPLVDMTRLYHPGRQKMYTCWNTRINARPSNFGTRIDYILASKGLKPFFKYSDILPDVLGSDHCPVYAEFLPMDQQQTTAIEPSPLLTSNFPEFKQNTLASYFAKPGLSALPSSATTIPLIPAPTTNATKPSKGTKRSQSTQDISSFFVSKKKPKPTDDEISNATKTMQQKDSDNIDLNALLEEAEEKQVTAKAWTSIFTAPVVPTCTFHKAPCIERTVTKKGPNFGRAFYLCSKPKGPQDGPRDEQSCNFFQWRQTRTKEKK